MPKNNVLFINLIFIYIKLISLYKNIYVSYEFDLFYVFRKKKLYIFHEKKFNFVKIICFKYYFIILSFFKNLFLLNYTFRVCINLCKLCNRILI